MSTGVHCNDTKQRQILTCPATPNTVVWEYTIFSNKTSHKKKLFIRLLIVHKHSGVARNLILEGPELTKSFEK